LFTIALANALMMVAGVTETSTKCRSHLLLGRYFHYQAIQHFYIPCATVYEFLEMEL